MGTAIKPAFDYLNANLPAALQSADPDVVVEDGWITNVAQHVFVIGRDAPGPPQAVSGTDAYLHLGAQQIDEEFTIPCYIGVWEGGDDESVARDAAVAIFDAFISFLRQDLTLGGALKNGRFAQVSSFRVEGTNDPGEAMEGRRCLISFSIHCKNLY